MATFGKKIADFFNPNLGDDNSEGLRSLFINELQRAYYIEKQLVSNLPDMADAATTDQLREAFHKHLEETRKQVARLEKVFTSIGADVDDRTSEAIDGLIDDANEVVDSTESGSLTRDAGLIIAAQKVEHLEIASYGSLHALAALLSYSEATQLIEQTLEEEKNTNWKLTEIAESFINERAKAEGNADPNYRSPNRINRHENVTAGGTLGV